MRLESDVEGVGKAGKCSLHVAAHIVQDQMEFVASRNWRVVNEDSL